MVLIPNFDVTEKMGKAVIKEAKFCPFLQLDCSIFKLKQCQKP